MSTGKIIATAKARKARGTAPLSTEQSKWEEKRRAGIIILVCSVVSVLLVVAGLIYEHRVHQHRLKMLEEFLSNYLTPTTETVTALKEAEDIAKNGPHRFNTAEEMFDSPGI